jgi:phage gpG-like protein
MADINFNFDGTAAIAELSKIRANAPQALNAVGVYLLTVAQTNITSQGSGLGWAPFKRLPKRPHQLLWDHGTLLRSLTVGDGNNVFQSSPGQVTIGSNVAYAAAQNFGVTSHDLPARPFLVFSSANEEAAGRVFINYLMGGPSNVG